MPRPMLSATAAAALVAGTAAASAGATWAVRGAMRRAGIMDRPALGPEGHRKRHRAPVAYEGGVALLAGFLAGLAAAAWLDTAFFFDRARVAALVLGASMATGLGVADDLLDLRPIPKLAGQAALGLFMWNAGFGIERLSNPFGDAIALWPWVSAAGTMLWFALLMNGINLVDGLDGLAAGIAAISAATVAAVAFDLGQDVAFALALVLCAACVGFLRFNFSPATIFMGDAGSLLLGFLLAALTLMSSTKAPALLALAVPAMAVGLPLFEAVFSFARRAARGEHPFRGDRRHLHHRLLGLGLSERRTVVVFYYLTAYFGVAAYVLQRLDARATLAMVAIVGAGLFVLVENLRYLERRHAGGGAGTKE